MKSTRIISLLMALTLLFVLCTACGTTPATTGATSGTTAPTTSPTTEDVFKSVKIGVSYDPTTFDPAELNLDSSYAAAFMIYEALLRDVDGVIGAGIAETWEHSTDMKEWTFTLRDSTFSDGTPVTAEDFKYSIMRSIDPAAAHANSQTLLNLVNASEYFNGTAQAADVGVEAVDEKTLKLTYVIPMFETEFTNFLYTPVNQAFAEAAGIEYGTASDKVMTNGAFELKEWVTDSSFTLAKNESYWDADAIQMDEVTFLIGAAGSDTAVDMMLTEQVDVTYFTTMNQVKTLEDAGYTAESITNSYRCLNLNHLGSTDDMAQFMSNLNFRKALNLAIDRENLCS